MYDMLCDTYDTKLKWIGIMVVEVLRLSSARASAYITLTIGKTRLQRGSHTANTRMVWGHNEHV